jgi:hypothetical protein
MLRLPTLVVGMAAGAAGHGSLVIPPARNNHRNVDPAAIFGPDNPAGANGTTFSVFGANGTGGGCCAGGSCLWFSEGCFIGCKTCTRLMPPGGNQINQPPEGCAPSEPTLPVAFRTFNAQNKSGNGDWTRYHPWRSPGKAPTSDVRLRTIPILEETLCQNTLPYLC